MHRKKSKKIKLEREKKMKEILVVVDMQNDFIDGALGTREAVSILPNVRALLESFEGEVFFTRDTHRENYESTQEGRNLPVRHCIKDTHGWQIADALLPYVKTENVFDKPAFGSCALAEYLGNRHQQEPISRITLVGLCTDICVISNAMLLKAFLPETEVVIRSSCCAGVTLQSHQNALDAMRVCQIIIE